MMQQLPSEKKNSPKDPFPVIKDLSKTFKDIARYWYGHGKRVIEKITFRLFPFPLARRGLFKGLDMALNPIGCRPVRFAWFHPVWGKNYYMLSPTGTIKTIEWWKENQIDVFNGGGNPDSPSPLGFPTASSFVAEDDSFVIDYYAGHPFYFALFPIEVYQLGNYTTDPFNMDICWKPSQLKYWGWISLKSYPVLSKHCCQIGRDFSNPSIPPESKNKDTNDMECCEDLREMIEDIHLKLGDMFFSVPRSIINTGETATQPKEEISDLTEFLAWQFEQLDQVFGEWEIPLEIQDASPEEGDQPASFRMKNLAEAISDMFLVLYGVVYNVEAILNMSHGNLIQGGQNLSISTKNHALTETIAAYLGYQRELEKASLPLQFTVGAERTEEFIKPSIQDIMVERFKHGHNFEMMLTRLLEAAAIIKAKYWIKGKSVEDIMNIFRTGSEIYKNLSQGKDPDTGETEEQKAWSDLETEFLGHPGNLNTEPYDRPFTDRPKITELGNTADEET